MKLDNPAYAKVYPDLVKRLANEYARIKQWEAHRKWLPNQVEHYYKCLALLELLENITVFYTGFGKYQSDSCFNDFDNRVQSFLEEEKK